VRIVDVRSEHYHVARQYMIRLEPRDLADPTMCATLARAAGLGPSEFRDAFAPVVATDA